MLGPQRASTEVWGNQRDHRWDGNRNTLAFRTHASRYARRYQPGDLEFWVLTAADRSFDTRCTDRATTS